jgi:hypothetical protein
MRDFGEEKAMACALRDALKAKTIETTPTDALELATFVPAGGNPKISAISPARWRATAGGLFGTRAQPC